MSEDKWLHETDDLVLSQPSSPVENYDETESENEQEIDCGITSPLSRFDIGNMRTEQVFKGPAWEEDLFYEDVSPEPSPEPTDSGRRYSYQDYDPFEPCVAPPSPQRPKTPPQEAPSPSKLTGANSWTGEPITEDAAKKVENHKARLKERSHLPLQHPNLWCDHVHDCLNIC